MIELLTTHLDTIIAFISGGGLLTLVTIRATKKQAEANAMKTVQAVYQETIRDLRADKEAMKLENEETKKELEELRKKVNKISQELATLMKYKCTVVNCEYREVE